MIVKEKILINIPLLYNEIIKEQVEKGNWIDRTAFIVEAIKEKFIKEKIEHTPIETPSFWQGNVEDMPLF